MSTFLSKVKSAAKKVVTNVTAGAKALGGVIASGAKNAVTNAQVSNSQLLAGVGAKSISPGQSAVNQAYASQTTKQQTPVPVGLQAQNSLKQSGAIFPRGASVPTSLDIAKSVAAGATGSSTSINAYGGFTPTTLSAGNRTMTAPKNMLSSAGDTQQTFYYKPTSSYETSSINSNVLSGGSSVSLPSTPSSLNPGAINNAGLVNALSDKQYNPETGLFTDIPQDPQQAEATKRKNEIADLLDLIPRKDDVNADPEVQRQQAEVQARKQELNNYTAQLNSIVAKQNADLLTLRGIGGAEGVTETVYGGQAAQINREAAIKALPIQAQISAAQGNLELAQDYLSDLKKIKQDAIDADFSYNMKKFDAIAGFVTGEQKTRLDDLRQKETRAYQTTQQNIEDQDAWARSVASVKPSLIGKINALNPASPTFRQELGQIVSQLPTPAVGGAVTGGGVLSTLPTSIQGKIISIAQGVGDSPIGKRYNSAVESANIVNGIDAKSKNPADHQAITYAFAKALDPDSAVKEGEYDTIKKYAQSTVSKYGKEITNAINGTGFLSEAAITNIKTTMNNLLTSRKPQFENLVKEQSRIIDNIAGKPVASEVMVNYAVGAPVSGGNTSNKPAPGSIIESGGKRYRVLADGETLEQI